MIGSRTLSSLAQFLELYETTLVVVLMNKHDIPTSIGVGRLLIEVLCSLRSANDEKVLSLLEEIVRTGGDLRVRVSPKYRYDERFSDLCRCLQLDGYIVENKKITSADPSINDAPSLEDDLLEALKKSDLPDSNEIVKKINDSTCSFRSSPPNYNACLNDIRVALETLARAIASNQQSRSSSINYETKWGAVINFLRQVEFITQEEEKGLAGVYGFISRGSHQPLGISEEQMARLGRSLALGMCWFLVKSYRSTP